jgi:hypothetical protein
MNQSTKINLIGCDTIVNSPTTHFLKPRMKTSKKMEKDRKKNGKRPQKKKNGRRPK